MPSLCEVLSIPLAPGSASLLALSGGGGKTSALFVIAEDLAERGARVLVTTTTRIRDPRAEGRKIARFLEIPAAAVSGSNQAAVLRVRAGRGSVTVLCAGVENGKLVGVDPGGFPALVSSGRWDAILVEADGAKMRPVKAPASNEPVWPAGVTTALGVIGLDCLDRPLDDRTAHHPELLGSLVGLPPCGMIELGHLLRLARHPEGLFRGAPEHARRILVLNKTDLRPDLDPGVLAERAAASLAKSGPVAPIAGTEETAGPRDPGAPGRVDLVLVCALADPDPERRVRAARAVPGAGVPAVY